MMQRGSKTVKRIGVLFLLLLLCLGLLIGCSTAYTGALGGTYEISSLTVRRKDVPIYFRAGGETLTGEIDIVYAYEIKGDEPEQTIRMVLREVVYNGSNEIIIENIKALNEEIASAENYRFFSFGGIKLAKETNGSYKEGDGYIEINGERLTEGKPSQSMTESET